MKVSSPIAFIAAIPLCAAGYGPAPESFASDSAPVPPGPFQEISSPAGTGSQTPHLSAGPSGVILSWLEPSGSGSDKAYSLKFSRRGEDAWTDPQIIIDRTDLFINWADFPSVIELTGGRLAAHWLQYNGSGTYAYQVRLAFSEDDGATWSESIIPHETETQTEHGFVSLLPAAEGVEVLWLDGRDYAVSGDTAVMSVRHATVGSDGSVGQETIVDARSCDCCQTTAAAIPGGAIASYRGRTREEIRDIHVVRYIDGSWTEPSVVHADNWHIPACPVNGSEISASGSHVGITWFTGASGEGRVYYAGSSDAGLTFGAPLRIDEGRPIGRVGVLSLGDGGALVSWLEYLGERSGAEVKARVVDRRGRVSRSVRIGASSTARASGFPVLALAGDQILVAWTDPGANRVRVAVGPAGR